MEDHFLYKLRNGQLKNSNSNGNYKSKKIVKHKKDLGISSDSQKQLNKLLEKMLDLQKNTLICLEKITAFQDRQSKAMLKIVSTLESINGLIPKEDTSKSNGLLEIKPSGENSSNKKPEIQDKKNKEKGLSPADKEALFETVSSMRSDDQTWNEIADYLKKEKISTLTGNGTWSPNLALYFYKKYYHKLRSCSN